MAEFVFKQLAGDRRELRLAGEFAPHGRPRRSPVVTDAVSVRNTAVYYPGNPVPTRHLFGTREESWTLTGRFSDRHSGDGFARYMTEFCKQFVAEQQRVSIKWAGIVGAVGLIESFAPGRESATEVAWSMTILVDEDTIRSSGSRFAAPKAYKPPGMTMSDITIMLNDALDNMLEVPPSMKIGILDALGNLVGSINSAVASVQAAVDSIGEFQKALVGELRRLRAGIRQLRTSLIKARRSYEDLTAGLALQSSLASESIRFWDVQNTVLATTSEVLARLDELDREAKEAERGKVRAVAVARTGDTWAAISQRAYGSAGRAADIQAANGETGEPVSGTTYIIPK